MWGWYEHCWPHSFQYQIAGRLPHASRSKVLLAAWSCSAAQ
jgi:hypothetical protein